MLRQPKLAQRNADARQATKEHKPKGSVKRELEDQPFLPGARRCDFTFVIKSSDSGPSGNQMEDPNTKCPGEPPCQDRVLCNQIEDE
jgi:hypothetical protein